VLVAVARFMIRVFNPVSFYYCLRADGTPAHVVAEVNNTFGDRHLYVLEGGDSYPLKREHAKQFHVSPFNNMEGAYAFTFSAPADEMRITIRLTRDGATVMDAAVWGHGKPLTTGNLWKTLLVHPFTAAMTMPRIMWQAAILHYRKKLPVFKRPEPDNPMTIKVRA
jgi:cyclopropane-fatty-acyl-phospholipid synthase